MPREGTSTAWPIMCIMYLFFCQINDVAYRDIIVLHVKQRMLIYFEQNLLCV